MVRKTSFQPTFITYLSRFLLNYDKSSANWWRNQLRDLPLSLERQQLSSIRERQFGQFSESVEVGLQKYQGKAGVRALFSFLRSRYGKSAQAKLQLALLFSIISPKNQPSALICRALGQADNGVVKQVCLLDGGAGYAREEAPTVTVSAPDGGGDAAAVRAELAVTGQLLRVNLADGGSGYAPGAYTPVSISPPTKPGGRPAQAVARIDDGRVISCELTDRGRGYRASDVVTVTIDPPRNEFGVPEKGGVAAKASVELEAGVVRLVLEDGGKGYARDQPLSIEVAGPVCGVGGRGATAKIEPLAYDPFSKPGLPSGGPYSDYYPDDSISTELLRLLPSTVRPTRRADGKYTFPLASGEALNNAKELNGGKTSGLDVNMESYLYAARKSSGLRQKLPFAADRDPTFGPIGTSPVEREASLSGRDYLAFAASGAVCTSLVRTVLVPLDVAKTLMQSSPEAYPALTPAIGSLWKEGCAEDDAGPLGGLASLYRSIDVTAVAGFLLGGFGFGVNEFLRRYFGGLVGLEAQAQYSLQISILAALGSVIITCLATCPFEVLRIRAIEAAAGAVRLDGVGASTPAPAPTTTTPPAAGVVEPTPASSSAQQLVPADESEASGLAASYADKIFGPLAAEGAPTKLASPEELRKLRGMLEGMRADGYPPEALTPLEVQLAERTAAGGGAAGDVGGARELAQPLPPSAFNMVNGLGTLYAEGGVATLYSALTPLLLRELPFSITKYLVYDSATQAITAAFPLAQEGPFATALLSLSAGLAAGVIAAAVSTPADTLLTLSQVPNGADADAEPPSMMQIAKQTIETDPLALFNGLLPRCVFFGALIAGQFLLYDNFKQLFKVGSNDITFYLDVFASTDLSFWPQSPTGL